MTILEDAIDAICRVDPVLAGLMNGYNSVIGNAANVKTTRPYLWLNGADTDDDVGGKAEAAVDREINMTLIMVDDLNATPSRAARSAERVRRLLHKQRDTVTAALSGTGFVCQMVIVSGPATDQGTAEDHRVYLALRAHLEEV